MSRDKRRIASLLRPHVPTYASSFAPSTACFSQANRLSPTQSTIGTLVGLVGLEPTTPALSRRCSNQLSYRPIPLHRLRSAADSFQQPISVGVQIKLQFSRKEVIQPHLPIRLPCYDFTPVTNPAVVIALLAVRLTTSGRTRSHGVTGGVYKTRERIHRDILIRDY